MAREITTRLLSEMIMTRSAWGAFTELADEGSMSMDDAVNYMRQMFKPGFLDQALEARGEIQKLWSAMPRLETICRAGAAAKTQAQMQAQVDALYDHIRMIDRIVVDFYETHLTMYGWIDPDQAKIKPTEMAKAMEALRQRRLKGEGLNLKDMAMFEKA